MWTSCSPTCAHACSSASQSSLLPLLLLLVAVSNSSWHRLPMHRWPTSMRERRAATKVQDNRTVLKQTHRVWDLSERVHGRTHVATILADQDNSWFEGVESVLLQLPLTPTPYNKGLTLPAVHAAQLYSVTDHHPMLTPHNPTQHQHSVNSTVVVMRLNTTQQVAHSPAHTEVLGSSPQIESSTRSPCRYAGSTREQGPQTPSLLPPPLTRGRSMIITPRPSIAPSSSPV
jgi:hypothetical protein